MRNQLNNKPSTEDIYDTYEDVIIKYLLTRNIKVVFRVN